RRCALTDDEFVGGSQSVSPYDCPALRAGPRSAPMPWLQGMRAFPAGFRWRAFPMRTQNSTHFDLLRFSSPTAFFPWFASSWCRASEAAEPATERRAAASDSGPRTSETLAPHALQQVVRSKDRFFGRVDLRIHTLDASKHPENVHEAAVQHVVDLVRQA